jgi:hypothetical protein
MTTSMIGRIVITSVPRGLDGGDGVQVVMRTQGLPAAIAERLAQLASYPHPFAFGDPQNPRVLFHRIERVGGRTIHVLGSVRDAGASYSGRSNLLAELVAIAANDIRSLPAGPFYAALRFPWLDRWDGEPREVPPAAEPQVPARDPDDPAETGRPIVCEAWEHAVGDAGWAGELAKSFFDGRRALVWTNKSVDAAALFAEAARLLPPSVRWQVEFNTCEIEPFPAHWRAVRQDLTVVGPRPFSQDLVLDLDVIRKAGGLKDGRRPDHPLADRARGKAAGTPLLVGDSAAAAGAAAPAHLTVGDEDESAVRERLKTIREDRQKRSGAGSRIASSRENATPGGGPLAAVAAVIGGLLACVVIVGAMFVVLAPDRASRLWADFRGGNAATSGKEADLRTTAEEEQRDEKARRIREADARAAESMAARDRQEAAKQAEEREKSLSEKQKQTQRAEQARQEMQRADEAKKIARQEASRAAIKSFKDNGEEKTVSIQPPQAAGFTVEAPRPAAVRDPLCAFDHENPTWECTIWSCVSPKQSKLWAKPNGPAAWSVMGQQFDSVLGDWRPPFEVCRLAAREGHLWLEWPNPEITTTHALFKALEISLLEVSCRDDEDIQADGKGKRLSRRIRFREPVVLASKQIDPLVPESILLDSATLARYVATIAEGDLHLKFKLTHPNLPEKLVTKREEKEPKSASSSTAKTPVEKLPNTQVLVGYKDANTKSNPPWKLRRLEGSPQITTEIEFVRSTERSVKPEIAIGVKSNITGLDKAQILKKLFTFNWLSQARESMNSSDAGPESFPAITKALDWKNRTQETGGGPENLVWPYLDLTVVLAPEAITKIDKDIKDMGLDEVRCRASCFGHLAVIVGRLQPWPAGEVKRIGYPYPDAEGKLRPYNDEQGRENLINTLNGHRNKLASIIRDLDEDIEEKLSQIAADDAKAISDAIKPMLRELKPTMFEVLSISAVATARDAEGKEKSPEVGEKAIEIELVKP